MCLYPRLQLNKKYTENQKNGGIIPPISDSRTLYVPVKCGNCKECREAKARDWIVRLIHEHKHRPGGKFVTLTFSNKSIKDLRAAVINKQIKAEVKLQNRKTIDNPTEKEKKLNKIRAKAKGYGLDNELATIAVRRFLERWRREYGRMNIKHWLVTELGHQGTENIHLHGIIWTDEPFKKIRKHWKYGWIYPRNEYEEAENYVSEITIKYIVKYITKIDKDHKHYKSKILSSKGIGGTYTESHEATANKFNGIETIETFKTTTGQEIALPIYYRNKLYTEEQRELLWLQKLDREIRWVNGIKIDISKGEEEYYTVLKYQQKWNEELGYGTDKKNWKEKEYEERRRDLMTLQRIKNAEK